MKKGLIYGEIFDIILTVKTHIRLALEGVLTKIDNCESLKSV